MRELVVQISVARRFRAAVSSTGLTKAGLTMTAAQSVLASVSTVSYGAEPVRSRTGAPARPPRRAGGARAAAAAASPA